MKKFWMRLSVLFIALSALFAVFCSTGCMEEKPVAPVEPVAPVNPVVPQDPEEPIEPAISYVAGEWNFYTYSYVGSAGADTVMEYGLYIPASYDGSVAYPLLTYIPDARYITSKLTSITAKAEGPVAWLTEEKIEKNPAIWLIPRITNANSCDASVEGSQAAQIVPIVDEVIAGLNIDENRLYLTGHSMGGIFFFSVNDIAPDKFAATVYVACQPGGTLYDEQYNAIMEHAPFVNQKFIYIASRGDEKAPVGQDEISAVLDENGIEYGLLYGFLPEDDDLEEKIKEVLDQGYSQNFLAFESVKSLGSSEHVYSFAPAYAIDAIYDWLFAQKR